MIPIFHTIPTPLKKTMDHSFNLLLSLLLVCSFAPLTVMCRDLVNPNPYPSLLERLKLDGEDSSTCWDSLFELQSCTGEIVLFFLNGETYLGPKCCDAIRTIQNHCWPTMLGSVGINGEESDILLGYCDAAADDDTPPHPPHHHHHPLPPSPPRAPNPIPHTTTSHVINPWSERIECFAWNHYLIMSVSVFWMFLPACIISSLVEEGTYKYTIWISKEFIF